MILFDLRPKNIEIDRKNVQALTKKKTFFCLKMEFFDQKNRG